MKVSEYHKLPTEFLVFNDSIGEINKEHSHQKNWDDLTPFKNIYLKQCLGLKGTYEPKSNIFVDYSKRTEEPLVRSQLFPILKDPTSQYRFKHLKEQYVSKRGEVFESENDDVECLVYYDYEYFVRNVEGLSWRELYLTIDNLIRVSGDYTHIYFDGFQKSSDGNYEVLLGS